MKLVSQFFKFAIVGIVSFALDYVILFVMTDVFKVYYLLSSFISLSVSLLVNYWLSMKFVFQCKEEMSKHRKFSVFLLLSVIGIVLTQYIMENLVERFHVYYMLAKVIATMVVTMWNFVSRKVFLESREEY